MWIRHSIPSMVRHQLHLCIGRNEGFLEIYSRNPIKIGINAIVYASIAIASTRLIYKRATVRNYDDFVVFLPFSASLKWLLLLAWLLVLGRLQLWKNHQRVIICARDRKSNESNCSFRTLWLMVVFARYQNDFSWRTQLRWISISIQRDAAQSSRDWIALARGKHTQNTGTKPLSCGDERKIRDYFFFRSCLLLLGFFAFDGISIWLFFFFDRTYKQ